MKLAPQPKLSRHDLTFRPLTRATWPDLEALFGQRGACGGCWCMSWRLKRADFERQKGTGNKRALRNLAASGAPVGVLAYRDGQPVGWCAVAPRSVYVRLEGSRVLKAVDDQPVWAVTCFFIARAHRRSGLSSQLLGAAVEYARKQGAKIVEGYPQDLHKDLPDAFVWTGLVPSFRKAGFKEVARRSPTRPVMRVSH
jgi:GNAT superfamily N-acetyltransferase